VTCSSATAAIVGPKTLVFTPSNYNTPQQVIVAGIPGASSSEPFEATLIACVFKALEPQDTQVGHTGEL
jgi:hypothetical protein